MKSQLIKKIFWGVVVLLSICGLYAFAPQQNGTVSIEVEGLRNSKGQVCVLAFASSDGYYKDKKKAKARKTFSIQNQKAICQFTDLPYGNYAFILIHDENYSEDIDTNMLGMPTEGIAVSNNAIGAFWQIKSFDEAKISLNQAVKAVKVKIMY